jgi:glutaconate CoA-transferase subunit B
MGVMDFEQESKRMRVISINPGYTFEDIQENCGFKLLRAEKMLATQAPKEQELKILREEVDPYSYVIGRS